MNATHIVRSAILASWLCALSAPILAQQTLQRPSAAPTVRSLEQQRVQEQQKKPASTVEHVQLNPQPLPPTPPDSSTQVTAPGPVIRVTPPDPIRPATQPGVSTIATTVPDNLFQLNDRAIIVVGGKQMQAGQVKREISAELERLSGAPVTVRSQARPGLEAASELVAPVATAPRRRANVPATAGPGAATTSQGPAVIQQTVTATNTIDYCQKNPAKILRVTGPLRPQQPFTIQGECFGERSGAVEISGLPGRLVFREWSNHRVVAVVPAVRGHADKSVGVTIVRADKARSAAVQADFVALRERVEVPAHKWAPNGNLRRQFAQTESGGAFLEAGISTAGESFRLAINPSCALTEAAWTQRVGRVTAFNGWEHGPPHAADVSIQWAPLCVTSTTSFVFTLATTEICEIAFDLHAWAQCPLGVAP